MSDNFRQIFMLQYNQFAKKGQQREAKQLWQLPHLDKLISDFRNSREDIDKIYAKNKKIFKRFNKKFNNKN